MQYSRIDMRKQERARKARFLESNLEPPATCREKIGEKAEKEQLVIEGPAVALFVKLFL